MVFLKRFSDLPYLKPVYLPYASETCFITPFVEETISSSRFAYGARFFKHHLTVAVCASFLGPLFYSIGRCACFCTSLVVVLSLWLGSVVSLKCSIVIPPAFMFLLRIALGTWSLFGTRINFRILGRNATLIFTGLALNLWVSFVM